MTNADDPALLDALADCLEPGGSLAEALEKIAAARGAATPWAQRVRRAARPDGAVARALRESGAIDDDEARILSAEDGGGTVVPALRAVAARRRRRLARRRAIQGGLVGPLAFGALTVVLAPLPNVVTGGDYARPVAYGLAALVVSALAIVAGVPALLRDPRARARALRLCAAVPGVRRLAALHAEEELAAALAPFASGGEVTAAGLAAAAALVEWSPIHEALRAMARSSRPSPGPLPMGGLEPIAGRLSPATNLAIVRGAAAKRLGERLAERAEAAGQKLTARLRLATRAGAYALLVLFSANSLAGMISRGLPGMPALPGGALGPDQKQLEDLLKQLEQ